MGLMLAHVSLPRIIHHRLVVKILGSDINVAEAAAGRSRHFGSAVRLLQVLDDICTC